MLIKTISRWQDIHGQKKRLHDIPTTQRNLDPALHPHQRAREYTRALNAVKLERLFAAPLVTALSGHIDGVYALATSFSNNHTVSGSGDGIVRVWGDDGVQESKAHQGKVQSISKTTNSLNFLSAGNDGNIKRWRVGSSKEVAVYTRPNAINAIHHHINKPWFVSGGVGGVHVWDHDRADPIQWGTNTISAIRFNHSETSIMAACAGSEVMLYDLRTATPLHKNILAMASNAVAWNPIEPFNFSVANEDHNCYTFDMRNMARAINVLKDHVSAVLDLDYSPTGLELATAGYDRTVRIFNARSGHSRDVYHTRRMQKVWCVRYNQDGSRIVSGSDDGNVRVWKSIAHDKLGSSSKREVAARNYSEKLKERYMHMPEISRIDKHRRVPKAIKKAQKTKAVQRESAKRKIENSIKAGAKNLARPVERKKHVVTTQQ